MCISYYIMLYHIISYYIIFNKIRVLEQNWASSKEVGRCQVPVLPKGPATVFVYVWESTFFANLGPPIVAAGNPVICYTSLRNDCITTVSVYFLRCQIYSPFLQHRAGGIFAPVEWRQRVILWHAQWPATAAYSLKAEAARQRTPAPPLGECHSGFAFVPISPWLTFT